MARHSEWFLRGHAAAFAAKRQQRGQLPPSPRDAWVAATQQTCVTRRRWEEFSAGWQLGLTAMMPTPESVRMAGPSHPQTPGTITRLETRAAS